MEMELRYLQLLSREFPTVQSVCAEIMNLNAILQLPKGTEHFRATSMGSTNLLSHFEQRVRGHLREDRRAV